MLTREEVTWGFRYCLGRDPESELTLQAHANLGSWQALRDGLLASEEFASAFQHPLFKDRWVMARVMQGARLLWLDLGDRYVSRACLLDNYEPAETDFIRRHLKPDSVFLDIGANIGWFTLLASTIVGDRGRIHCFEPRPQTCAFLRRTLDANALTNLVTLHECGLSNCDGIAYLNWAEGTDNPGGSFVSGHSASRDFVSQQIKLQTLDVLAIEHADFIKIDIEGSEYKAFQGAQRLFRNSRPIILSEVNPEALRNISGVSPNEYLNMFTSLGYRIEIVGNIRKGELITEYPSDWPLSLLNVGMVPAEKAHAK